jgi:hypothetical protein
MFKYRTYEWIWMKFSREVMALWYILKSFFQYPAAGGTNKNMADE